jgi:tetratricopeptide (TPR) repeat protein
MIADAPVFGHGPGSYEWVYGQYKSNPIDRAFDYAHNEYLHTLAEYGWAGLALLAALACVVGACMCRAAVSSYRERDARLCAALAGSLAASLVHACFDFNFHIFANNHLLVLLAGITVGALFASGNRKAWKLQPPSQWILGVVVVTCSMVLIVFCARVYLSHRLYTEGLKIAERLEFEEAANVFERARAIDPGHWEPYVGLGDVAGTRAFWALRPEDRTEHARTAVTHYGETLERNPRSIEALLGLARALIELGEKDAAAAELEKVMAWSAYNRIHMEVAGLLYLRLDLRDRAREAFENGHVAGSSDTIRLNLEKLNRAP